MEEIVEGRARRQEYGDGAERRADDRQEGAEPSASGVTSMPMGNEKAIAVA